MRGGSYAQTTTAHAPAGMLGTSCTLTLGELFAFGCVRAMEELCLRRLTARVLAGPAHIAMGCSPLSQVDFILPLDAIAPKLIKLVGVAAE